MSNEVINTYQQFLDDDGQPLANGTIEFYVNEDTTLASIWSNDAFTTAQANPYTLSASGCITGDVKYPGLRTLLIKNADGAHVRTIDNVGTMGTGGGGNVPYDMTLAEFKASTILVAGDVVTISDRAGATFDIASGVSGANTYDVIANTAGTLKATLRVVGHVYNAEAFGAPTDNSTDAYAALARVAAAAAADYAASAKSITIDFGEHFYKLSAAYTISDIDYLTVLGNPRFTSTHSDDFVLNFHNCAFLRIPGEL